MQQHKISVIMPVYNCELYIKEAVDSILNQTYTDFEFLIIDDASKDKTVSIIKEYDDSRIRLIEKPENTGYTNSLNLGLELAKGIYIARMDGDDISHPVRFFKQVAFLESNQDVILCGSWFSLLGSDRIVKVPENHEDIKLAFLKGNCIAHPSVMIRKQYLNDFSVVYDVSKEPAEDYDLWVRLMLKGRLHNLQEVMLNYRTHINQVSKKKNDKQKDSVMETKRNLFNYLELDLLPDEELVLNKVLNNGATINFNDIYVFKKLQKKLLVSNPRDFFEPLGFKKDMLDLEKIIIKSYFLKQSKFKPKTYLEYLKIKKTIHFKLDTISEFKLAVKSLIFYNHKV
jgi:glycosyltransferase involved in cell wall biosynthesis